MDFNNFDCPQYVNFETELNEYEDSLIDAEAASCSAKSDMDVEDGHMSSYYSEDERPQSGNMQSNLHESHLVDSNNQDSVCESEYMTEDFPVNYAGNSLLPEKNQERKKKSNKTKTVPFRLIESKKRKRDEHIPMAEQIAAFHRKTPQRFHTTGSKAYEPMAHWSPELINPKSPNLQAVKRRRRIDVLSREEQEAKEVEEMKRYRFRARSIRYNVSSNPKLPKVCKKLPTRPRSLNLKTAERAAEINARKKEEEKPFEFHARPVPKSVLNGSIAVKEKPIHPVTEAKTPNFALKKRAEKWEAENRLKKAAVEPQTFKAMPVPTSSPFEIKHEKKRTEIQPFSFDEKDKERLAKKEKKIAEEIEKENKVFVFKAQLLPSPTQSSLPNVPKKPLTHPQPFSFLSDGRNSKHSSFNLSTDQVCPSFKANPATVLVKPPFIPEKPPKEPIEVKEFQLYTDIRASHRQKLKEINDIKEQEKELALQHYRELQEEEERKEILKLRKEIVHKANPIRHYKPVEIKGSRKPLTHPVSPKFHTDERLQSKHQE